jgi:hypothetical protein
VVAGPPCKPAQVDQLDRELGAWRDLQMPYVRCAGMKG